jgi:hypothetical protein
MPPCGAFAEPSLTTNEGPFAFRKPGDVVFARPTFLEFQRFTAILTNSTEEIGNDDYEAGSLELPLESAAGKD